jgi:hypothetical protein
MTGMKGLTLRTCLLNIINIGDKTNQLLTKEQIKPKEIEALRVVVNEAVENTSSESERAEYEKMGEKLDIIQSIAELKERAKIK